MSEFTSLLFASPSFLEGVGRMLDMGDTLTEFNRFRSGGEADGAALAADWRAVGQDIKDAVGKVRGADGAEPESEAR